MSDHEQVRRKRFVQGLANERERDLQDHARVRRRAASIRGKLQASGSGNPRRDPLRDPDRDQRIFNAIKAALASGDVVRLAASTGDAVTDMRHHKRRKRRTEKGGDGLVITGESTFWTPHWDHAGDRLKAMAWAFAAMQRGGYAMTVHLGPEVIEAARESSLGFAAYMRDRMTRHLRPAIGGLMVQPPELFFSVEAATRIDPHLHGVVIIPEHPAAFEAVKSALEKAGGNWEPKHLRVQITPLKTPERWASYISKWREGTREFLRDSSIVAATSGLRRLARQWYEAARSSGRPI